ncbi:flagellar basal body-associated FliL family protein [bacterium]|nr:flagellar basal body-associated FliL family protein [bacterium]
MAEEGSEETGGGSKKFLMIVILLLLLLIGGAAAAYMFLFSTDESTATKENQTSQEQIEEDITAATQKEASKLANPIYSPAKKYVVNLRDGRHFLTIKLVVAMEDPEALEFIASREPIIDDMILSLLGNLTSEDINTPSGKTLLKREIYKKINSVFTQKFIDDSDTRDTTPVKKILFTEFILN